MIPTKHNLAADIADRFHGPNRDSSKHNTAAVVATLLEPLYQEILDLRTKNSLLTTMKDHLTAMEERQRSLANELRAQLEQLRADAKDRAIERDLSS